jgi:hypothetical protein
MAEDGSSPHARGTGRRPSPSGRTGCPSRIRPARHASGRSPRRSRSDRGPLPPAPPALRPPGRGLASGRGPSRRRGMPPATAPGPLLVRRQRPPGREQLARIIPARAGNGPRRRGSPGHSPDHPRTRGERVSSRMSPSGVSGSSTHARGTDLPAARPQALRRIIPARAGNGVSPRNVQGTSTDHPRTRGERGTSGPDAIALAGSSPHARGTGGAVQSLGSEGRIIPARAGNGGPLRERAPRAADHPRTRGERRW